MRRLNAISKLNTGQDPVAHLLPVLKNSLTILQTRQLSRLRPHKRPLPSIPRLLPRLHQHPPIKVQIPRRLAPLANSPKRRLEDIPRRPRRRPQNVGVRVEVQDERVDDLEEQHADEPRRKPLHPGGHGARVDTEDADALCLRGCGQARLELVLHHDQEQLRGAVPAVPPAPALAVGRGAPVAPGDGVEAGGVGDEGLVPRVVEGLRACISGVIGTRKVRPGSVAVC